MGEAVRGPSDRPRGRRSPNPRAILGRAAILLALAAAAGGTSVADARAQSPGTYAGTLTCERTPAFRTLVQAPFQLTVEGAQAAYAREVQAVDGSPMGLPEAGRAPIAPDGALALDARIEAGSFLYDAHYEGTLGERTGRLKGTQTWTLADRSQVSRPCTITLSRAAARTPRRAPADGGPGGAIAPEATRAGAAASVGASPPDAPAAAPSAPAPALPPPGAPPGPSRSASPGATPEPSAGPAPPGSAPGTERGTGGAPRPPARRAATAPPRATAPSSAPPPVGDPSARGIEDASAPGEAAPRPPAARRATARAIARPPAARRPSPTPPEGGVQESEP